MLEPILHKILDELKAIRQASAPRTNWLVSSPEIELPTEPASESQLTTRERASGWDDRPEPEEERAVNPRPPGYNARPRGAHWPVRPQPAPKPSPGDPDIVDVAVEAVSNYLPDAGVVTGLVMEDLLYRQAQSVDKYGTPLQPNNGRNALADLYQELLDAYNYEVQLEQEGASTAYGPALLDMILSIRLRLDREGPDGVYSAYAPEDPADG